MISLDCTQALQLLVTSSQEDEVRHHKRMEAAQDGEPAVKARWASFAWEREMPPALHDISLEAMKGQLVMVVGVVGSGKSSLIAALLGELHSRGGTVEVLYIGKVLNQEPVSYNSTSQGAVLMCSNMSPYWSLVHVCTFHTYINAFLSTYINAFLSFGPSVHLAYCLPCGLRAGMLEGP